MMKSTDNRFIKQAGILAVAGILCRIIGILYRSPLTNIIGDEGNGYYSSAYNIYTIILLVSSYSIPSAISKIISQRLALKEYRNAHRIFRCSILYVVIAGIIGSLFAFFCADFLVGSNAVPVLRIFAPTIFLSGLLGVLRGYFQAHGSMVQTSVSQILEQILNAVISILAAYLLIQSFTGADMTQKAIRGASGSALGTGAGVLTALIFVFAVYMFNRRTIVRRIERDTVHKTESYREISKIILFMVTPVILSTFIYNFSTSLNQTIYSKILESTTALTNAQIATSYGIFSGKAIVITNIPIAIATAMSSAMIPSISGTYALGDSEQTNAKISSAIRITMLIAIPAAVGMTVLARPIVQLLFPQKSSLDLAASLLRCLGVTVVLYSLSTLTNAVLQAVGKVNLPVRNASISLVIQTVALVLLLYFTDAGLYALVAATIVYSLFMCIFNGISVRNFLDYRQEIGDTFLKPVLISIVIGGIAWAVYVGCVRFIHSNTISLFLSIAAAALFYFLMILKLHLLNAADLGRKGDN